MTVNDAHSRQARVKAVFVDVVERPAAEREALIEVACASEPDIAAEVRALLAALDAAPDALAQPTASLPHSADNDEMVGQSVGHYKLLQRIGEGGFGSVYMAQQLEHVHRRVAVKVIKLGMDTKQVIARFEAERQALALMDHPSIARVLDAGATDTGRPYFAMELVRGVPITQFCADHRSATRQRLEMFLSVCRAIQHAHQKGIIHRDIKPSNVLITVADGKPLPKVIDFGIAKATGPRLTDKTLFTEFRQLLGTPEYMSPEQAETNGVDVDTRSDIYSLGVLLYELLTGTTPFDANRLRSAAIDELKRIIREEEPPKPSTRVSRATAAPSNAPAHDRAPALLARTLRGELDWIVMKAMDKERSRRYETADALAADIERYLRHEPVLAGPPTAAYRLRKWIRRNRGTFIATSLVLASLVAGLSFATLGLWRATHERERADIKAAEAVRQSYRASIAAAAAAIQLGDGAEARRRLSAAESSLRGWESKLLDHLSDRSLRTFNLAVDDLSAGVLCGEYANAEVAGRSVITRWTDGARVSLDDPGLGHILAIAVSPDASHLLASRWFGLSLHDFRTGKTIKAWRETGRFITDPFSPDGSLFYIVRHGEPWIDIHRSTDGSLIRSLPKPARGDRTFVAVSSAGDRVVVETGADQSSILDAAQGTTLRTIPGVQPRFTPDGRRVITCTQVASGLPFLHVFDSATGRLVASTPMPGVVLTDMGSRANSIAISPDSSTLALQTGAGDVRLLDLETMEQQASLVGPNPYGKGVGFSSDGRYVAALFSDGRGMVWSASIQSSPYRVPGDQLVNASANAFDATGRWLLQGDWGRLILRSATTGEPQWTTFPSLEGWQAAAFAPSGTEFAVCGDRGTIARFDTASGRMLSSATPLGFRAFGANATRCIAWSPDSTKLAVGFADNLVLILSADSFSIITRSATAQPPRAVMWITPDTLAITAGDAVEVRSISQPRPLAEFPLHSAHALAMDGDLLAAGGDAQVLAFTVKDRRERFRLAVASPVLSLALRNDLSRLAVGREDGAAVLLDASTGEEVATFNLSPASRVAALAWPAEDILASTPHHALVRLEASSQSPAVLDQREEFRRCLAIIEHARSHFPFLTDIADRLDHDLDLPARTREHAARLARTIGEHAALLNNLSALELNRPLSDADLALALRRTELAVARTDDPYALNIRGKILCVAKHFDQALDCLDRAQRGYARTRQNWPVHSPMIAPYRVAALAGLGRSDEAQALFRELQADTAFANSPEGQQALAQCAAALSPGTP